MKGDNSRVMRALYIVLVPVVLLTIALNSGWFQRWFTAATVHGERYNVVRYNFYYFECCRTLQEEQRDWLEENGFDPLRSPGEQYLPDGEVTWKEYFQAQAEKEMSRTAYYCALAQAAGYQFSEAEMAPVAERLAWHDAQRAVYNISADNYYVSYYGAGMSEEAYAQELTRVVQARAYEAYLVSAAQPGQAEIDQWLSQAGMRDYQTADLRVITLQALPDRGTGEIGGEQLAALSEKLDRLCARYGQGVPFETLQAAFSSCTLGDETGVLEEAIAADLPDVLADWCLTGQEALRSGETCAVVDKETGTAYFAVLDGLGGSGLERAAREALSVQSVAEREAQALEEYTVERSRIGMMLATA